MNIEDTALEACKEASRRIAKLNDRNKVVGVGAYGDETLIADRIAEETIIEILSSRSKLSFLSEERGFVNNQSDYVAIIDPLDGSSNYRNGNRSLLSQLHFTQRSLNHYKDLFTFHFSKAFTLER